MKFATEENIYKCKDCNALQGEKDLEVTKLTTGSILQCHVCNSKNIKQHTPEPIVGVEKCSTCLETAVGCFVSMFIKKPVLKCKYHKTQ